MPRQEDCEFKASLGHIENPVQREGKKPPKYKVWENHERPFIVFCHYDCI
jgi:hypothetical protein